MKYLCAAVLLGAYVALVYARNDYDFELFKERVDQRCLQRWYTNENGQRDMYPTGNSLEAFISMVEKLEEKHEEWDLYRITRELLKRFAFEEIVFKTLGRERVPAQRTVYKHRWEVLSKLLPDDDSEDNFPEEDLSDEEKCTLFFMMGHLVNNTYRVGWDGVATDGLDEPQDASAQHSPAIKIKLTDHPREQGVVSVNGNPHQAIAISKVLNAIIASTRHDQPVAQDIIPDISNKNFPKDSPIDPVIGVTLGDVVTLAAMHDKDGSEGLRFFGPEGTWNKTFCPTEYQLHGKATGATHALLRGAVDGFLISEALKSWNGNTNNLRLSRVLRSYYSPRGIPMGKANVPSVSYCSRRDGASSAGMNQITDSVLVYYYLLYWKENTQVLPNTKDIVNDAVSKMMNALGELDSKSEMVTDECDRINKPQTDKPTCETPSNVFVILDTSEVKSQGFDEQETIVGNLVSKIDFSHGSGAVHVYRDGRSGNELDAIAFNSTNPNIGICETWLKKNDRNNHGNREGNEVVILDALNKTLQTFELKYDLQAGIPSKAVVWFHFGDLEEKDKNRVNSAATVLKNGHRDTRLFVVGEKKDELSVLTRDPSDVLNDKGQMERILLEKVCKVPAIFQFNRCWDHHRTTRKEDLNVFNGFVTPDHVQYWAFHPEYYLKSYNIDVKFAADQGDITVCEQRGVDTPGINQDGFLSKDKHNCKTTDNSNRELVFKFSNPCDGYDVNSCPTMNFAIVGHQPQSKNTLSCTGSDDKDPMCRKLDQVKFTVSHDGISCSGCDFLKASPLVLLAISLFYFKN